ncbi:hypothetical protein GOODEAATRI_019309 [Goodea atripinnis]|uniref:Dynein heavy chain linker domain-containing protein n=1 Tax=Goodea atripinnis TaxID=208336 RepID=A0ABV0N2P7_9TELE
MKKELLAGSGFCFRHWRQIYEELERSFDHTSADFTLEKIISLKMDHYAGSICEISGAASKELSIEQGLEGIKKTWEEIFLDITPYKEEGLFRLRGTGDLFQTLDDSQMILSTMRASCFVKAFEREVDQWEQQLSHMLDVIEMILTVQRNWIYLEVQNLRLLENLSNMSTKLEEILKAMDVYLENKRQIFPRFYFLSNDDMLEILGQSQNPEAMQPHMKKCFDNIKSLQLDKVEN